MCDPLDYNDAIISEADVTYQDWADEMEQASMEMNEEMNEDLPF